MGGEKVGMGRRRWEKWSCLCRAEHQIGCGRVLTAGVCDRAPGAAVRPLSAIPGPQRRRFAV